MSGARRATSLLIAAVLAVAGCADSGDGDASGAPTTAAAGAAATIPADELTDLTGSTTVAIGVVDNSYEPRYARIVAGSTITFTNRGDTVHNITPATAGAFEPIEADRFAPGDVATLVLDTPGVVAYYCSIHGTPRNGQNGAFEVVAR